MLRLASVFLSISAAASAAAPPRDAGDGISTPYMWVGSTGGGYDISRIDTANGGVTVFSKACRADWGAVDPAGDFWITDQGAGLVCRIRASSGAVATFRPGFLNPSAIAIDAAGDVYVGQYKPYHGVFKLRGSDGSVLWHNPDVAPLEGSWTLAVDASGNVWVPDRAEQGQVYKLDGSDGRLLGTYDAGSWPVGIAVDGEGSIWVANQLSGQLTKLDGSDGRRIGSYHVAPNAMNLAIDGSGDIWVPTNSNVVKVDPGGRVVGTFNAGPKPNGGIAVDSAGHVWVVNATMNSVTELDSSGAMIGTHQCGSTSGGMGDFTGFALQRFVMRKGGAWSRLKDMPLAVQGAAIRAVGTLAYVAGGANAVSKNLGRGYSSLWAFDPARESWAQLPDLPYPRYEAAVGASGGILYVAGGASFEGGVPAGDKNGFSSRLDAYDTRRQVWTALAPVPEPGMSRGAFLNGFLYVVGAQCSDRMMAYDPAKDSWSRKPPMPTPRCASSVIALGGKLYVLGGQGGGGQTRDAVEVYDPKTGSWSALPPMPTARTSFMSAVLGGRIHVMGGWRGSRRLATHEAFDPRSGQWYSAAPLPEPRSHTGALALGGKLYVLGGRAGRPDASVDLDETSHVLAYDPSKDRLRPLSPAQPVAQIRPVQPPPPARTPSPPPDLVPARRGRERPDDFALVVGVERYRSLPAASYAERDASAFARYARAVLGVPEENTILLTGERATKTDIAKYVEEWLPRNVAEASRVYVFYSGHGAPDPAKGTAHLMPWDGDPAFLQTSAYPLGRLYERLSRLKAREVVVMLDACFSGVGGRSVIAPGLRPLVLVQEAVVPKGDKLTVLAAASSDETAGSLDSQRHGLFTYYLLKGIDGAADPEGSGHVDVSGLHGYVRQNVLRAARRQNREQNPVLRAPDKGLRLY